MSVDLKAWYFYDATYHQLIDNLNPVPFKVLQAFSVYIEIER